MKKQDLVLSIEIANDLAGHEILDTFFSYILMDGDDFGNEKIIETSEIEKHCTNEDMINCPAPTMAEIISIFPEYVCIGNYRYDVQHYRHDEMFISEIGDTEGVEGQWQGFSDEKKPVDPCGKLAVWLFDNGYKDKLNL